MGYRIVRMTGELFQALLTEGATFPTAEGRVLRVTKGLPPGAEFVELSPYLFFDTNEWALKFRHPSWPDARPGECIPELEIRFAEERPEPAVLVSPDVTAEDAAYLRDALALSPSGKLVSVPPGGPVFRRD